MQGFFYLPNLLTKKHEVYIEQSISSQGIFVCLLFNVSSQRILFLFVCWLFYVPFVNISLIGDVIIVGGGLQHLDLNSAPTALKHGEIYALTRSLGSRPRFHPRTAPYSHDTTLCDKRREYWRLLSDSHGSLRGWGWGGKEQWKDAPSLPIFSRLITTRYDSYFISLFITYQCYFLLLWKKV